MIPDPTAFGPQATNPPPAAMTPIGPGALPSAFWCQTSIRSQSTPGVAARGEARDDAVGTAVGVAALGRTGVGATEVVTDPTGEVAEQPPRTSPRTGRKRRPLTIFMSRRRPAQADVTKTGQCGDCSEVRLRVGPLQVDPSGTNGPSAVRTAMNSGWPKSTWTSHVAIRWTPPGAPNSNTTSWPS